MFLVHKVTSAFIKEVSGLGNIPKKGCIIASNHLSFLDPPLTGSLIYIRLKVKLHYLGKKELFKPVLGRLLHNSVETIPIDTTGKDKSWFKMAVQYLNKDEIIGIFPEGGRSKDGKLQKGKTGAVRLALAARVPVVPLGIQGTYSLWSRNQKLFRIKKIVKINIGKPIYFDKYYKKPVNKKLLRDLTRKVMKKIGELCGEKYSY